MQSDVNKIPNPGLRRGKANFSVSDIRSGAQLSELIHKVCHEIGNPLTAIISMASVFHSFTEEVAKDQEKLSNYALSILGEAWRISALNERLVLLLSEREVEVECCEIEEALSRAIARFNSRDKSSQGKVSFKIEIGNQCPQAMVNAQQCMFLLGELLHNATDAVLADSLSPEVTVRFDENETETIIQIVNQRNDACPFPLDDCFKPFVTERLEQKHLGLGLAVAQAIIERTSGKLLLEEEARDEGYEFRSIVILPRP